ncbi:hypothetical protein AEA09_12725 [Lysinibacillus contaminans]|uniref:Uncharacterized protein n=1 Tax=Lysinibacillus contaminans TaxID=1293441 RepID=A0ABR5K555_9BACI|nr:hypothetical protein AEA09_12725 [Lysinibacillus contaminans]
MLLNAIIPIIIGFGVSGIVSFFFRNKEKVDNGFEFIYYRLSYRKKMMRTLWNLPLIFLALISINIFADLQIYENLIIFILFLSGFFLQLFYNFYRWKKEEI